MRKLLIGFLATTAALHGQAAPSASALKALTAGACGEVMGVDCSTDPGQLNLYYDILSWLASQPVSAKNQATIVQQFLNPFVSARINMKQAIIDRAFKALGRTATPPDETRWLGVYNSWQTYQRLVPMIRAASPLPTQTPAPPQISKQQQQQAIQAAFAKIWMRAPNAGEAGQFSSLQPAQIESASRSMLSRYPGEAPRIVDAVFTPTIRRQPTAYERTGVISVFGRYWTGADDLATYLNGVRASYYTPNNGPNTTAGGNPAAMAIITNSYITDFGRNISDAERAYWATVPASDSRIQSPGTMQQNNLAYLKTSPAERQNLIITAIRSTWGVTLPASAKEVQTWDQQVAKGTISYSGVKRASDLIKAANPAYVPGQPLKAALVKPNQYGVQSLGDDLLALPMNFVLGTLNTALTVAVTVNPINLLPVATGFGTAQGRSGPQPPAQPSNPPAPMGAPAMRVRPIDLYAGPYIIAAAQLTLQLRCAWIQVAGMRARWW
jgi:hypothetical protein